MIDNTLILYIMFHKSASEKSQHLFFFQTSFKIISLKGEQCFVTANKTPYEIRTFTYWLNYAMLVRQHTLKSLVARHKFMP